MRYFIEYEWETRPKRGPDMHFDCPACHRVDVVGETTETIYLGRVFWVLPILRSRETTIRCPECHEELGVVCTLADLAKLNREQLGRVIRYRAGCGGTALTVLSLLFCWNPVLCLPLALGAKWALRATKGWQRAGSTVSLCITLAVILIVAILLISEAAGGKK